MVPFVRVRRVLTRCVFVRVCLSVCMCVCVLCGASRFRVVVNLLFLGLMGATAGSVALVVQSAARVSCDASATPTIR